MPPILVQLLEEFLALAVRKSVWVILEVAIELHVVNIGPIYGHDC